MQSGFVPGNSTVNQLVDIYNTFCKALDNGLEVRAVFCDISKAFDRACHKGLINKLKKAGLNGLLLDWLSDYLTNRKQKVVIPGAHLIGSLSELAYLKDIFSAQCFFYYT